MSKHTTTWRTVENAPGMGHRVVSKDGTGLFIGSSDFKTCERICQALNSHEALVEALDALDRYSQEQKGYHGSPCEAQVHSALALAKREEDSARKAQKEKP